MFKKISTPELKIIQTNDETINRIQRQLYEINRSLANLSEQLFVVEKTIDGDRAVVDRVLFQAEDSDVVYTSPPRSYPQRLRPVGFGRRIDGNRVTISTLFHYSDAIRMGGLYKLQRPDFTFEPTNDHTSAVIIGIQDGIGVILHEHLRMFTN